MHTARVGQIAIEDFVVVDSIGQPVAGLVQADFNTLLFDPAGALSAVAVVIFEMQQGVYRSIFVPSDEGMWCLLVKHSIYFPAGKSASILVYQHDIDTLADLAQQILNVESGNWELVGSEMIFRKPDNTEIMRFTITTDGLGNPIKRERV